MNIEKLQKELENIYTQARKLAEEHQVYISFVAGPWKFSEDRIVVQEIVLGKHEPPVLKEMETEYANYKYYIIPKEKEKEKEKTA